MLKKLAKSLLMMVLIFTTVFPVMGASAHAEETYADDFSVCQQRSCVRRIG